MSDTSESPTAEPIDIILLAYNRLAHLQRMVESIEVHTHHPFRLTIVDNGSEADVRAWLHAERGRFHEVVFNARNEHLAGLQRGIARTTSSRYVVSDADLLVPDLGPDHCWLRQLSGLMDRHPDFGMIGCRIEGLPMPEWHRIGGAETRVVDDEIIEGATGVWLNLINRGAFDGPFQSDGMTCHALARDGYRVGVGLDLLCEHLGDEDPWRYPDYLARKNAANGLRSVYLEYPELRDVVRPPTLTECALAAPILEELDHLGVAVEATVELLRAGAQPIVAAVAVSAVSIALESSDPVESGVTTTRADAPISDAAAAASVAVMLDGLDPALVRECARVSGGAVVLVVAGQMDAPPAGFDLREVRPPNDVVLSMTRWADRSRSLRHRIGYSTLERQDDWLGLFRAARFGARRLRMYVLERQVDAELIGPVSLRCQGCGDAPTPLCSCGATHVRTGPRPYRAPFGRTVRGAVGARVTQIGRAVTLEWRRVRRR